MVTPTGQVARRPAPGRRARGNHHLRAAAGSESDPDSPPDAWPKAPRQFAVINARGEVAVHTGPKANMQSAAMIVLKENGGPWLNNNVVLSGDYAGGFAVGEDVLVKEVEMDGIVDLQSPQLECHAWRGAGGWPNLGRPSDILRSRMLRLGAQIRF